MDKLSRRVVLVMPPHTGITGNDHRGVMAQVYVATSVRWRRWVVLAMGAVAGLLYANFLLDWSGSGLASVGTMISDLEAPGHPAATLLRVTDVACAVLVIAILPFARRALPAGGWRRLSITLMVIFALGAIFAAVVPSLCQDGQACVGAQALAHTRAHNGASIVSDSAAFAAMATVWCALSREGPSWLRRFAAYDAIFGGIVSSAVFGFFNLTRHPAWAVGASQRLHVLSISVWIVALAVAGMWDHRTG